MTCESGGAFPACDDDLMRVDLAEVPTDDMDVIRELDPRLEAFVEKRWSTEVPSTCVDYSSGREHRCIFDPR